jgi:hypothetical protein
MKQKKKSWSDWTQDFQDTPVLKIQFATHRQHIASIIMINRFVPFGEITGVYCEIRTKRTKARTCVRKMKNPER